MKITEEMKDCFAITHKKFIDHEDNEFICHTLPSYHEAYEDCKKFIQKAVTEFEKGKYVTLECWLKAKLNRELTNYEKHKLHQHRIDWLARLAQGIDEEGVWSLH